MNTLSYKIEPSSNPRFYPNVFKIVVDGLVTSFYFDIAGLQFSLKNPGIWPIFICSCGYLGCNGYYVNTVVTKDKVIWNDFYEGYYDYQETNENSPDEVVMLVTSSQDELRKTTLPPLIFNKKEYVKLIDDMIAAMSDYPEQLKEYQKYVDNYSRDFRFHE